MENNEKILADYLSEPAVSTELKLTPRTLRSHRQQGIGPPWVRVGRDVYYPKAGLRAWLKDQEVAPRRSRSKKSGA